MGREKTKPLLTSFTPRGDLLAIADSDGAVKIWNTKNGNLQAEWKDQDVNYSCIKCGFVREKHRKKRGTSILALGTLEGDVLAINIITGEKMWKSIACHTGGVSALSFGNEGRILHTTGADGMVSELESQTGELKGQFKASKGPVSSLAISSDGKLLALTNSKIRLFNLETKTELCKLSSGPGTAQFMALREDGKAFVLAVSGEKQLQVWKCDGGSWHRNASTVLSLRNPPVMVDCKKSYKDEDGLVVLSVSESGIAYIWHLTSESQDAMPTRITVKSFKSEVDPLLSSKKNWVSIIASKLHDLKEDGGAFVLVGYGSMANPQFSIVEVTVYGEDTVVTAGDEVLVPRTEVDTPHGNGYLMAKGSTADIVLHNTEAIDAPTETKRVRKKRAASDMDRADAGVNVNAGCAEVTNEGIIDDDLNEPTMGEKLASLNLIDAANMKSPDKQNLTSDPVLPSADSVYVLLKQALHADDRSLLLECLHTQDEKVIKNSTSSLSPSDTLKLLNCLIAMLNSRGAALFCVIPWLKSLLLQQASYIMSQKSSLFALNSLYQLIESRVSTFGPVLQLSSTLDLLFSEISGDMADDSSMIPSVTYEDNEDSDGELTDAMETDDESEEVEANVHHDAEESNGDDD